MRVEDSSYPLMGTRIVLDEEKIKQEGKYNLDEMYAKIDEMAQVCNMQKHDRHTFYAIKGEKSLSDLGIFIWSYLMKAKWVTTNVKEWVWLDEDEGDESLMDKAKEYSRK
ncbi:hypothetical protein OFO10_04690 [Campylobacter sp. VBCF_06 NA8]|uniref:hypothetical protein n=1 Tax=Campylobacter sp. VBCF_06 NA8 TaxID=2983822 RepID=UPI0022E9B6C6|nr:hypothetical protein [Campylobacter sp. VBCF_06 NA8]MDA3046449.1 hypothetical protein [Campylobacter sp. VBCF_06 NA8]